MCNKKNGGVPYHFVPHLNLSFKSLYVIDGQTVVNEDLIYECQGQRAETKVDNDHTAYFNSSKQTYWGRMHDADVSASLRLKLTYDGLAH